MDKEQIATSPWREAVVMLAKSFREYFKDRTSAFLTDGGKIDLSKGTAGFTGLLPITQGGTGTDVGFLDHSHDGTRKQGQKLLQANTHETPDTDVADNSLHHTIGTGAHQVAPGVHQLTGTHHSETGLTTGDVLTATGPTTFSFSPIPVQRGSAWTILTAGTTSAPTIVFSGGQVVMVEIYR